MSENILLRCNVSELKIYIVGESSGDPADWADALGCRALVAARNEEEARTLAGDPLDNSPVSELRLSAPIRICYEERYGDCT